MRKLHYSWVVCICCSLVFLCSVGLTTSGFSVFLPYVKETIGLSNSAASTVITIRQIVSAVAIVLFPKINKKVGPKNCIVFAMVCLCAAFFSFAFAKSFFLFGVGGFFAGLGYSFGGTVSVSYLISNWFESKKALATSIALSGSGLALIVFSPMVTAITEKVSLRAAFLVVAFFMLFVCIMSVCLLASTPEDKKCTKYSEGIIEQKGEKQYGQGLSYGWFCFALVGIFFNGLSGNTTSIYFASLFKSVGIDPYTVSLIASVYGIGTFVSKFFFGAISDKKGCKFSFTVFQFTYLIGACLKIFSYTGSVALAFTSKIIEGLGVPTCTAGLSLAAIEFSNKENYVKRLSTMQLVNSIGGTLASIIGGRLADYFGSFIPVAISEAVYVFCAGLIVYICFTKIKKSEN